MPEKNQKQTKAILIRSLSKNKNFEERKRKLCFVLDLHIQIKDAWKQVKFQLNVYESLFYRFIASKISRP